MSPVYDTFTINVSTAIIFVKYCANSVIIINDHGHLADESEPIITHTTLPQTHDLCSELDIETQMHIETEMCIQNVLAPNRRTHHSESNACVVQLQGLDANAGAPSHDVPALGNKCSSP